MPQPADDHVENDMGFDQVLADGTVEDLRQALKSGADVNRPGRTGVTPLMAALGSRDLEKARLLLEHGADPELTDDFNATALKHAVDADFVEGVRLLLNLKVDRGYHPRYPLKKIDYEGSWPAVPMPEALEDVMSEDEWKASVEQTQATIRELGQNPTVEPVITGVQSVEMLKLFLEAGDDLNLAPTEIKRAWIGLPDGAELTVGSSDYEMHKSPRFGNANPERMDFPFWKDMIRTGGNAYSAREAFNDNEPFTRRGIVWCYDRFGSSLTPLADGRFVQIGGEHEDYYDPDFYIYNDVVVHDGNGGSEIYGYPRDIFPPTDFHTATLGRDGIYIIGGLGYPDQRRVGFTPVYRLTLDYWKIESVATSGEMPGWLHRHQASFDSLRNSIRVTGGKIDMEVENGERDLVANGHQFELDLGQMHWRRINVD